MNDSLPTRIHVIEKKTGRVLPHKFITDPQFTFHHVNAFERNNESENSFHLVVDISSYDAKHFDMKNFSYDKMESGK
jgi:carotenoid cleavage dioxygenase-like enzyme